MQDSQKYYTEGGKASLKKYIRESTMYVKCKNIHTARGKERRTGGPLCMEQEDRNQGCTEGHLHVFNSLFF